MGKAQPRFSINLNNALAFLTFMSFRDQWRSFREKLKWLDPFTYVDLWVMPKINPNKNKAVEWIVYIVFAFIFALALYTILGLLLQTRSPMVIVLSGSMEPTMYRGDVVVLTGVAPENIKNTIINGSWRKAAYNASPPNPDG